MKKVFISLFSLALLVVPCSCGDDDDDEKNGRQEVVNDGDSKGGDADDQSKENGKDPSKKTEFECDIKPLKRNLCFAGDDVFYVDLKSNRPLGDLVVYVEDKEGNKYDVEKYAFVDRIQIHTPDVVGDLYLVIADTDGTNPQRVEFRNLDEENSKSIMSNLDSPYIDLLNARGVSKAEAESQSSSVWLRFDEEKGVVGANGVSVKFDNGESSLIETGRTTQFTLSNGYEGIIVLVMINRSPGITPEFSFAYCLK